MKRNEDSLRDLWDSIKHISIHFIGVPEGEEGDKGPDKIFEALIAENFLKARESKQSTKLRKRSVPGRRNTLRHIVIKLTKIKERYKILKAARKKWQITYKGTPIRLSTDFSTDTLQARREWHDIFKMMKGKNLQPRILYSPRFSFILMEKSKAFQTSKS